MKLNGKWNCVVWEENHRHYEIEGTVPGCVHTDLLNAGIIKDIYWRTNADDIQWIENADVTYSRTFTVENPEQNAVLVFEGLDVYCDVFLNGVKIGAADNMFHAWEFPADAAIKAGENVIEVKFRSPVREVADLPFRSGAFTKERMHTRRIQCTYGWDWVGRFVTMGIWKDVRLEYRGQDSLDNVYVYTDNVNPYTAQVGVQVCVKDITLEGMVSMEILSPEGHCLYKKQRMVLEETVFELVDIPNPQLWYPVGYGAQPLYTLKVTCGEKSQTVGFGIRTVKILEIEDAPDSEEAKKAKQLQSYPHLEKWDHNEGSSCFILLVNDVKIFCKGANWVPCEPFPSAETPEKIERLVTLAKQSGVNMLRVWGGGIMENDAFYTACDRQGIMVTQDFFMACGHYPEEDDAFIEKLKREARHTALQLRNHPSLVWWSGDNENAVSGNENQIDYHGRRAALEGIAPMLKIYDAQRRFLPSSPYGGVPYASAVRGTTHNTQFLGDLFKYIRTGDLTEYRSVFEQYLARFTAEQPIMGMPFASSLKKFLSNEDIYGDDQTVSEYHCKNNPGFKGVTLFGYVDLLSKGIFGGYKDGADRLKKMQMLQCEWVRISLELFRRNQWFSSGIIYWMYNDCWPASNSWSIVDYYGMPKPAYYTFKRCAKSVLASVTKEEGLYRVYISNNGLTPAVGTGRLYGYNILSGEEKTIAEFKVDSEANEAYVAVSVPEKELAGLITEQTVILCDITTDLGGDRAFYLPYNWDKMPWEDGSIMVLSQTEDTLTVTADVCLPVAMLDVPEVLEDNSIFLKKGEIRTLAIHRF